MGITSKAQCLKITQKVAFNIASEASYIYILSGQKFIKKAKNGQFWRGFEKLKLPVNRVTRPDNVKRAKIVGKSQDWKIENATF